MSQVTSETLATRLRHRFDAVMLRVRGALDLPSRAELLELTQRLEELDRRIAALAAERVAAMSTVVPALPEALASEEPAMETEIADTEPERPGADQKKNGKKGSARTRKK